VHYRQVAAVEQPAVALRILQVIAAHPEIRAARGKQVVEAIPALPWNKGAAMRWIGARHPGHVPLYAGDDTTDEDAFRVLGTDGFAILIAEAPRPTAARLWLRSPAELRELLERLLAA